ncbi:MAG: hypothetical protein NT030_07735 [Candidatus Saganbacteria bacterium]|nr:hypothetical protein [Candidatus Saganbacteria bacterium]
MDLRRFSIIFALSFLLLPSLANLACPEEKKSGSLKVYSKIGYISLYLDNEFAGETPFGSDKIQVGSHLLTGVLTGETVYESMVDIKEGEVTTIMISEKKVSDRKLPWVKGEEQEKKESEAIKTKPISGPFFRIGYASVDYYSYYVGGPEFAASSLSFGIGYKLAITSSIDIMLTIDKADYGSSTKHFYIAPVSLLFVMSYYQNPYLMGKQYYGIGLSQYMTDLETEDGDNLAVFGYTVVYGMEMPLSEKNTMFFDIVYNMADNSQYEYVLDGVSILGGMRFGL